MYVYIYKQGINKYLHNNQLFNISNHTPPRTTTMQSELLQIGIAGLIPVYNEDKANPQSFQEAGSQIQAASQSNKGTSPNKKQSMVNPYANCAKTYTSLNFIQTVDKNMKISQLKKNIQKKTGIPVKIMQLEINDNFLNDGESFEELKIKNYDCIKLGVTEAKCQFDFSDFKQKKIQIGFVSKQKRQNRHQFFTSGLNYKGVCPNTPEQCPASGKSVFMEAGFVTKMNVGNQIWETKCPTCNINCKATSILYYDTYIKIDGRRSNGEKYSFEDRTRGNNYVHFLNGDQNMSKWASLQITTRPLNQARN